MTDCEYPCPCGYFGDSVTACTCSSAMITRYQNKISGPLLDRIDIHIEVPRVDYDKLTDDRRGESSSQIRSRVETARQRQLDRFKGTTILANADMGVKEVQTHTQLDAQGTALMRSAMQQMQLSARAYHRVLKLSRTIADLADSEAIKSPHLAEALQYRSRT